MVLMADKSVHVSIFKFEEAKVGDVFDIHCIEMFDYKLYLMQHKSSLRSTSMCASVVVLNVSLFAT